MLIDASIAESQLFYESANLDTFPIKYFYTSQKKELLELLRNKFQNGFNRISFIFHDPSVLNKAFLDNSCFFVKDDLLPDQTVFSENVLCLTNLVNEFQIKYLDFLACNTLKYNNWKKFYELLNTKTGVVCGASNDATGNLMRGADWVMENTNEDVKNIYFNNNIDNYASTLEATTISKNGGTILFRYITEIEYSIDNGGNWTNVGSNYPINIINTSNSWSNILTIEFISDITVNNVNEYFVCASSYITFDGLNNTVLVDNIIDYPGLIQNGTSTLSGYRAITVKNINTNAQLSYLSAEAGWLCQSFFAKNSSGSITNCSNSGALFPYTSAGICGSFAGQNGGTITIMNCSNSGAISASLSAGICGEQAGQNGGTVTITNCSNSGELNGLFSAGICGAGAGENGGTVTINHCSNSGKLNGSGEELFSNGNGSAGICGSFAGFNGGAVTINRCFNTNNITSNYSGGIAGYFFGCNTNATCSIINCYNIGIISGSWNGGICGPDVGYDDTNAYSPKVNIINCYTLGTINNNCGGILSGTTQSYTHIPTVTLSNCYSYGICVDDDSGLIANSLTIKDSVNINNCYIANGIWNDINANAVLTGEPVSNPGIGASWSSIQSNTPYLLSVYNNAIANTSTELLEAINSNAIYINIMSSVEINYDLIVSNKKVLLNSASSSIKITRTL